MHFREKHPFQDMMKDIFKRNLRVVVEKLDIDDYQENQIDFVRSPLDHEEPKKKVLRSTKEIPTFTNKNERTNITTTIINDVKENVDNSETNDNEDELLSDEYVQIEIVNCS